MQYPCTLKNNIYHSNRREQPPFFHSDTNTWPCSGPFCWQNPCSGCNSGTDWFAALEYILFQLCSNIEQISYVHKIPKKLCKPPCCGSNQPLSKLHHFFTWYALFKVATFLFCSCLSPTIVHLRHLLFLSTRVARMLLTLKRVSRRKDVKKLSINIIYQN